MLAASRFGLRRTGGLASGPAPWTTACSRVIVAEEPAGAACAGAGEGRGRQGDGNEKRAEHVKHLSSGATGASVALQDIRTS
ncbi:MAG: hypothetical protein MZV64_43280 [Ignavibacteriales bacterium]|nr:hypothetical protein [Ignavibacteriales bacterium]